MYWVHQSPVVHLVHVDGAVAAVELVADPAIVLLRVFIFIYSICWIYRAEQKSGS